MLIRFGDAKVQGFEDSYIKELEKEGIKIFEMWHPAARKSKREMIDAVKNG